MIESVIEFAEVEDNESNETETYDILDNIHSFDDHLLYHLLRVGL